MYLLYLKYLKVLESTIISALYVVADRFEKMPDRTHLCIECVFGFCKVLARESKMYQIYQG